MKIGIVCYPTFGGSGVVATELGMALADKGHEVHFITYNQPVRLDFLSHNLHFHQVVIEEYPLFEYQPYELALSTKMVEVVRKYSLRSTARALCHTACVCSIYGKANVKREGFRCKSGNYIAWYRYYFSWQSPNL